jgi:hypothetical protein
MAPFRGAMAAGETGVPDQFAGVRPDVALQKAKENC